MMNMRMMPILTFGFWFFVSATVTTSDAATIFGGSRIVTIDKDQRTITFKTKEGETWTLPVNDPALLERQTLAKNDQVTVEIDLDDRINNVIKLSEVPTAPRAERDTEDR
jgi:hypothetical protein